MQNRTDTPAAMRELAERARRHARALWPHVVSTELLDYAKELEEGADQLERPGTASAPAPHQGSAFMC